MTQNKKNIYVGIIIIVLVLINPFIINWLILRPSLFEHIGTGVDWLSFWGGYLGAIISAAVAFYILAIQYKQNKNENEKNRTLQINVIIHQQEREQLHSITKISSELISSVNPIEIMHLARQIGIINSNVIIERLQDIISKIQNHNNELLLYIDTDKRVKNKDLVLKIGAHTFNFITTLKDIENLIVIFDRYNNDIKIDDFKDAGLFVANVTKELQNAIIEYGKIKKEYLSYADCRSIAIKRIEYIINLQYDFQMVISNYIEFERERINQMLRE